MIINDLEYLEIIPNSEVSNDISGGVRRGRSAMAQLGVPATISVVGTKNATTAGNPLTGYVATAQGTIQVLAQGNNYAFGEGAIAGGVAVGYLFGVGGAASAIPAGRAIAY